MASRVIASRVGSTMAIHATRQHRPFLFRATRCASLHVQASAPMTMHLGTSPGHIVVCISPLMAFLDIWPAASEGARPVKWVA